MSHKKKDDFMEEYLKQVQEQQDQMLGIIDNPIVASFFDPEFLNEKKKELSQKKKAKE